MRNKKRGRPTKYKAEYPGMILKFFSIEEPSYTVSYNKQGTVKYIPRRLPTMERFAAEVGVTVGTLWNWAHKTNPNTGDPINPEFLEAYTRAKNCQMAYVLEAGFVGALRGSFLNLYMKNAHGWSGTVKQEATHSRSIDLEQVNRDLEDAAKQEAENYQALLNEGVAGKFAT